MKAERNLKKIRSVVKKKLKLKGNPAAKKPAEKNADNIISLVIKGPVFNGAFSFTL